MNGLLLTNVVSGGGGPDSLPFLIIALAPYVSVRHPAPASGDRGSISSATKADRRSKVP